MAVVAPDGCGSGVPRRAHCVPWTGRAIAGARAARRRPRGARTEVRRVRIGRAPGVVVDAHTVAEAACTRLQAADRACSGGRARIASLSRGVPDPGSARGARRRRARWRCPAPSRAPSSRCCCCTPSRPSAPTGSRRRCGARTRRRARRRRVQVHVSRLRKALGDAAALVHTRGRLRAADRARRSSTRSASRPRARARGATSSPRAGAEAAATALERRAGACGAGRRWASSPYEPFAQRERARLEELRADGARAARRGAARARPPRGGASASSRR